MKSESDRVAFVRNFRIPCAEESKEDDGAVLHHHIPDVDPLFLDPPFFGRREQDNPRDS